MPAGREDLLNRPLPNPSDKSEQVLLEKARGLVVLIGVVLLVDLLLCLSQVLFSPF